jgi:sulfur carrier protein ThiS
MLLSLHNHLCWFTADKKGQLEVHLSGPKPLKEVLIELELPSAEVALVIYNGEYANIEDLIVTNQDRVDLYPPIGGGSR